MIRQSLPLALAIFCVSATLFAQAPNPPYSGQADELAARLNQLENETQSLRTEVQWLREHPVRLPEVQATPTGMAPAMTAPADGGEYFTLDELRGEMKKLAWTKGDFTITPYGYLWANMVYSTQRTTPGSYTLFVQSASVSPEGEFIIDGRNTRLGFDIGGPRIPFFGCAKTGGKIEVDFQNSVLSTENKATILLRHAYLEAKNDDYRLLFGQTWDVISPLYPGTLLYSVGWEAGNIGYRRAQLRGERYLHFSDTSLVTLQVSANQQVFEDGGAVISGEAPNWPIFEGRAGWTIGQRGEGWLPITVGLSGHIGPEQFDLAGGRRNNQRRTWSGNLDFNVPFTENWGVQGECFAGDNLGAFLGGIGQGLNPVTLLPIRSRGGWVETWYKWTPALSSHAGYLLDDPVNGDLAPGQKCYNQFFFGNLAYNFTKQFLMGIEVSSWKTHYIGLEPGNSVRCEFMARYGF